MGVSFNHRHRKCLTPDSYRERPPDQGQVVRKVELWYRFRVKVAPYSFWTARELISKISRWREFSISTLKSRAESRSKMPTNMGSKIFKICLSIMLRGSPPV